MQIRSVILALLFASAAAAADYDKHVRELRPKLPKGFTVVIEPPFVVVGDDPPAVVQRHAERTIKWSVQRLKQDYFPKDPEHTYLCYYLQEKGLLLKFYKEFQAGVKDDPTGYKTLARILGMKENTMNAFKKRWEEYVLALAQR